MVAPRAVRIPRASAAAPSTGSPSSDAPAASAAAPDVVDRRPNRAGIRRATRISTIYLGALLIMYIGFVLLDRAGPGGTGPSATPGLLWFSGVAALLGLAGFLVTFWPVARAVEIRPAAVTIVESTGRRRTFPPLPELRVDVVRRYPAGVLAPEPVEVVQVYGRRGSFSYHLGEGLLPEQRPSPARGT